MPNPSVRSSILTDGEQFTVRLSHYAAGLVQPAHDHSSSQISFLLAGSVEEKTDDSEFRLNTAHICWKPKAKAHSNRFGPTGALILCFQFKCEETADQARPAGGVAWQRMNDMQFGDALASIRSEGDSMSDWLWDQLGGAHARASGGQVPEWLKWARDRIETAPRDSGIAGLADLAGVHRVHLSREFRRHFGITPTAFRQRHMASSALNRIVHQNVPHAIAAHEAGFVDQSHMIRTIKRALGCGVGRLVKALA